MFDLLKKLTGIVGVSGNEEEIREAIKEEIKDCVDEVKVDALGNLIAVKKGKGKKIMVAAHMDEIGIMVTYIDDNGFLRFSAIGGVSRYDSIGQRVKFKNGVVGAVYYEEKLDDIKNLQLSKMYIDIGAKSKEEAKNMVQVGDVACFVGDTVLQGDTVISKALDNRSGCFVVVKAIKELKETDNEIYFVFTVQEEVGLRGARTAAFSINPDIAIAVDVTMTGDTPESHPMEVKCGGGPAIKIKDRSVLCHPEVRRLLEESAKRINIPYQLEILEAGGSDPGSIHLTAGGIPSGAISIPVRYVHSPVETASMSDINNAVRLLVEAIC
ncbi:M42 family metallopeptidase [Acetivibrio mesophilus]|uniref:M42 family peptidase n=1 Tax=Acetivibrio mesophilus TaxID=2487273 RepID=A0A4Q0IAR5_9FIRM|nr:M42 family metallopeptidase [Acetivibrio mesophilus]RXE60162.1 M42 family peptidase [Acetivibrio mesophilus]HHV29080.1 M42 family metallopeptidase [Clostridium sp.]